MTFRIGTNIPSLQAQRQLAKSTDSLATISEKLASGQRINRASDDAAGLAISMSLSNQKTLSNKAIQNLSDGISSISIISGALEQQKLIVTRLSELAEQSANGTLSNAQRSSLSVEYEALVKEFGRIGDSTKFNGINLMHAIRNPGFSKIMLQAGMDGSSISTLQLNTIDTGTLSGTIDLAQVPSAGSPLSEPIPQDAVTMTELFAHHNEFIKTQFVDSAGNTLDAYVMLFDTAGLYSAPSIRIYVKSEATNGSVSSNPQHWVALIDNGTTDSFTEGSYESDGIVTFHGQLNGLAGGRTIQLSSYKLGAIRMSDTENFLTDVVDRGGKTSLEATGVETTGRALDALETTRRRLNELNNYTGELGAYEKRVEIAISNLSNQRLNFAQAQSRIMDTDIAEESAQYVSTQIRQQAAVAILAQTNNSSRLVLDLLGT